MTIRHYPDPGLAEVSQRLVEFEGGVLVETLVANMDKLVIHNRGIGLAAIQVGMPVRLFLYMDQTSTYQAVVNPVVSEHEGSCLQDEGCLSVPGGFVQVERAEQVRLQGLTITGAPIDRVLTGLSARIVQHELDHLDGILMIDKVTRQQRRNALRHMDKTLAHA